MQTLLLYYPAAVNTEISKKLPIMLKVSKSFPQYQFVVAKAPALEDEFLQRFYKALHKRVVSKK
jgi:lipid-A-disaccharide synthase